MIGDQQKINEFLNYQKIPKLDFDDLLFIHRETATLGLAPKQSKNILKWFRFLQEIEIKGWRTKPTTRSILRVLARDEILFYALFCPSYKKGPGQFGFRTDEVGQTSFSGIKNLLQIFRKTSDLGFKCQKPQAIFFDLALEQPEETTKKKQLADLEKNINNFRRALPTEVGFTRLKDLSPDLFKLIGYLGVKFDPLPIPADIFERIVERGRKFYQRFGWIESQIIERSKVIASSEAVVGERLRKIYPQGILVYTPTMLERGAVYSGLKINSDPHPIIYPTK